MFIVSSYYLAVALCIVTMLCWGSWANTQKLAGKTWRFELFYWDYVIGIVLLSAIFGLTLGSTGDHGRSFVQDLSRAEWSHLGSAFLGGIVFNLANILIVAAIAIAGMSVAFPTGIGLALVLGVIINYISQKSGNPWLLFSGIALVTVAIIIDALAYKKHSETKEKTPSKGIILSLAGGILMSLFYFLVQRSMSMNFSRPEAGKLTPYSAVFIFSLGILASNFIFNTFLMKKPIEGSPVSFKDYFNGNFKTHLVGILGGVIWCVGMSFSIISAEKAGPAISYGLGQGATMVAAFWGVFVWKEFKNSPKGTNRLLTLMFLSFIIGLGLVVYAGIDKSTENITGTPNIENNSNPVKIILDTDFGSTNGDIDDLGTVALAHGLMNNEECDLLGVALCINNGHAVQAIDAVNTYFGRGDIPVAYTDGPLIYMDTSFAHHVAKNFDHDIVPEKAPQATPLYRKLLSNAENNSIKIAVVGNTINIENLLKSEADEFSTLSGKELFDQKVDKLYLMGGKFPESDKPTVNFKYSGKCGTKYVVENCPRPIEFIGTRIGSKERGFNTGARLNELPDNSPVKACFSYWFKHPVNWYELPPSDTIRDHSIWDQITFLVAVRGSEKWFDKVENGTCIVDCDGGNSWDNQTNSSHSYLKISADPLSFANSIIEPLMMSQPIDTIID